jgi:septum site-determining protein MinC
MAATPTPPTAFELTDTRLSLVTVALKSADAAVLAAELERRLAETPNFFDHDPVVVDLAALRQEDAAVDFAEVLRLLRAHRAAPVMAAGGSAAQMAAALEAGLAAAPEALPPARVKTVEVEVVREVSVPVPTLIVDRPLRSGQQVYAKGGDVVVIGAVNPGAEVIADGHVHVHGPLRGRAIAGAKGNADARILATCLEAELLAIAGVYRTAETALPADVAGRAAQVRLDGGKLVMEPLKG